MESGAYTSNKKNRLTSFCASFWRIDTVSVVCQTKVSDNGNTVRNRDEGRILASSLEPKRVFISRQQNRVGLPSTAVTVPKCLENNKSYYD